MKRTRSMLLLLLAIGAGGAAPGPQHGEGPTIREVVVPVGSSAVRALCTAGPTRVLVLHGRGSGAEAWLPVLERLAGHVGACAYDRPGIGHVGSTPTERGWLELEDELRRIHVELGARLRPVLVGHGVGGLYARLFALGRPADVGGLLLVEPSHEDLPEAARHGMPASAYAAWQRKRARPNGDGVRESQLGARSGDRLPDVPVTVITATRRAQGDGFDERFLNQAARRVHASVLRGVTAGRHIPARTGPAVHLERPDLVADEISRIVRAASWTGR